MNDAWRASLPDPFQDRRLHVQELNVSMHLLALDGKRRYATVRGMTEKEYKYATRLVKFIIFTSATIWVVFEIFTHFI